MNTSSGVSSPRTQESSDGGYFLAGHGEPLVLIHGNASTHETWSGVVGGLEPHFQCISYDLRGHGSRSSRVETYDLDDLVADLERLRIRLGIEKAHIVGHSLGGIIGVSYARSYPDRVKTLCMMATPAGRTDEKKAKAKDFAQLIRKDGVEATLGSRVESWYTADFAAANPNVLEQRLEQIVEINADTFLNDLDIYAETEIEPWLAEIDVPTLVMTGEFATGSGPQMSELIRSRLSNSQLIIFKGLKNGILTEIPQLVAEELRLFIRSR